MSGHGMALVAMVLYNSLFLSWVYGFAFFFFFFFFFVSKALLIEFGMWLRISILISPRFLFFHPGWSTWVDFCWT